MDFQLKPLRLAQAATIRTPALVVLVPASFSPADDALSALIQHAQASGHFLTTPAGQLLSSFGAAGIKAERVVLASTGGATPAEVRKAAAAAVGALKGGPARSAILCFAQTPAPDVAAAAVQGAAEAAYTYTTTKSKPSKKDGTPLTQITIGVPGAVSDIASIQPAFTQAVGVARGVAMAREWANRPANHATPTMLAEAARALSKLPRIGCEVLGPKEVAKLGMGAFRAVAQGSEQELRFIVLRYNGAAKSSAPVALVGKGITFDTGGISLKPAPEMDEMKFDMGGAASVLGVFRALAEVKPAVNVVGLIAACENMPDGRAVKPGDVVTSMSGQTIEILNIDAEGRLVLCDALTYAERFKPRALVDIATLTGACVIALGHLRSGLFTADDGLAAALQSAGEHALDPCWRMPLDDEYAEGLKTNFADVANVAGRPAGSITAAKFLQRFTQAYPWAHLDIAGTAWKSGAAKGATGRPVGLLMAYLSAQANEQAGGPKNNKPRKSTQSAKPRRRKP
ncbi:leucyl aminopeptidase [Ottowia sp.]|uniref:leucyl aminopeptidase n=1 Tax=Ottowia sp. TaxID=1898956 RepID=UPI003A898F53